VERRKKGIGRAESVAGEIREVLGDIAVPPLSIVWEEGAKFFRGRNGGPSNTNDNMKGMKESMDAGNVGGTLMGHSKEHNEGVRRGSRRMRGKGRRRSDRNG